ncbi:DNA-binding NarL/FixJ family response regulator [Streptomyces pseudovenezuelae]|uniref:DNA-binding NarL/FixJ family response regulator n=1 Tax=Streptomyces pseudovenezuelae TaxID=67350 RepID=A0ABT6LFL3_9ACTN|nr:DNA-binding NarL/FixJ family response regulator [Streptomyces pseudovenezuelae]
MADTRITVVIADDQQLVRTGFSLILGAQPGIDVVGEAADGVECVELARRLRPDVVLTDIRMPRLDGLDVVRQLAGPGVVDPMNVVLITTFDQDDYVRTGLRNGACGFLLKDASPGLLVEAVQAAARGTRWCRPR